MWTPVFGPLVKVDFWVWLFGVEKRISWPPQEVIDVTETTSF